MFLQTVNSILFVYQCLNVRNDCKKSDMSLESRIADKDDFRTLVLKECDTNNETEGDTSNDTKRN